MVVVVIARWQLLPDSVRANTCHFPNVSFAGLKRAPFTLLGFGPIAAAGPGRRGEDDARLKSVNRLGATDQHDNSLQTRPRLQARHHR